MGFRCQIHNSEAESTGELKQTFGLPENHLMGGVVFWQGTGLTGLGGHVVLCWPWPWPWPWHWHMPIYQPLQGAWAGSSMLLQPGFSSQHSQLAHPPAPK